MRLMVCMSILLPLFAMGQQNLVPNGTFELLSECPWDGSLIELAIPWTNSGGGGSPDIYNACVNPSMDQRWDVPDNFWGYQHASSGNGYAGIFVYNGPYSSSSEGREYTQIKLEQPLNAGIEYHVSFYVSLADTFNYAVANMGAYFSDSLIVRSNYSALNVEPQIEWSGGVIADKLNWTLIEGFYTPRYSGEEYMLVGNLRSDNESTIVLVDSLGAFIGDKSYYYLDDVSVVAVDTISGIEEAEQLQFDVYPNPNNGRFEVRASEPLRQGATLMVYDTQGRAVLQQQMQKGMSSTTVNTEHLAKGVYALRLWSDDGSFGWEKVVVQ